MCVSLPRFVSGVFKLYVYGYTCVCFMTCLALLAENVEVVGIWTLFRVSSSFRMSSLICGLFRLASGTGFPLYFKISPEHVSGSMSSEGCKRLRSLPSIWNWAENHEQGATGVWREIMWWHSFLLLYGNLYMSGLSWDSEPNHVPPCAVWDYPGSP